MKNVIGLGAGLVLAAGVHQEVEAATFTPDMWVYEVTLTATDLLPTRGDAVATADTIDRLPPGCTASPFTGLELIVVCSSIPAEIDLIATITNEPFASLRTRTAKIGFNAHRSVCEDLLMGLCPSDLTNSTGIPTFGGAIFYSEVAFDAALGELFYCATVTGGFSVCYGLSPTNGVVIKAPENGFVFAEAGAVVSGFWDFGNGGSWSAGGDSTFSFSGTGRLVSQPQVVSLPAPVLMLGSGLMALGALRARRKVRSGGIARSA